MSADAGLDRVREILACVDCSQHIAHSQQETAHAIYYAAYCDDCARLLRDAIRQEALEEAAKVPDQWANSQSCSEHQHDPCCHVRTGAGIARAIRALSQEVEPHA